MATLYVRNVPSKLYDELKRWAADSGRSVNREVLEVLESEAARRKQRNAWWRKVQALRAEVSLSPDARPEDLIREDREHGHSF